MVPHNKQMNARPKLRWPLDIQLINLDSTGAGTEQALIVQCPLGVSQKPLFLVPAVGQILSSLEGELSCEELLARFAPQGLRRETLDELVQLLDDHLFLANARYFAAERSMKDAYRTLAVRPPALAGLSYPEQADRLEGLIDGFLVRDANVSSSEELRCLVAPHIDYRRGGSCYGQIYPHLSASRATTYIVMGTAHQYSRHMFHLSPKDFESPLGRLPCDTEAVAQVAHRYGVTRAFADEYLHKREHSLELQLPFISRVKPGVAIVPILVGSFHKAVASGRSPQEFEEYASFVGALRDVLAEKIRNGEQICFIAGVDMAHVGPQFGDTSPLSLEQMTCVAARDREYLDAIAGHDCERVFSHIAEDGDARRICGFPTMYTILDILRGLGITVRSSFESYAQAVDYPGGCAVTFAGMALGSPKTQIS
jgi:AmmeMemoRadiSam system protein B